MFHVGSTAIPGLRAKPVQVSLSVRSGEGLSQHAEVPQTATLGHSCRLRHMLNRSTHLPARREGPMRRAPRQLCEVAALDSGRRAVRDSKAPAGPALTFIAAEWSALSAGARAGEFD